MDELLERLKVTEVLAAKNEKVPDDIRAAVKFVAKRLAKVNEEIEVTPITKSLKYNYDYGDGWEVDIVMEEKYICALLLFFSVFGLWHKANSAHFSGSYEKICSQIKKLTCNCSFSELTSHTTKEISSTSFPAFCRMYPSP